MQHLDIGNLDLQVHASPKRPPERRPGPQSVAATWLFKHQLGAFAFKEGEPFFWTVVEHPKTEHARVDRKTVGDVGNDQFWNQRWSHGRLPGNAP